MELFSRSHLNPPPQESNRAPRFIPSFYLCDEGFVLRKDWAESEKPCLETDLQLLENYEEEKRLCRAFFASHLKSCSNCGKRIPQVGKTIKIPTKALIFGISLRLRNLFSKGGKVSKIDFSTLPKV